MEYKDDMQINDDDFFEPRSQYIMKFERFIDSTSTQHVYRWIFTSLLTLWILIKVLIFHGYYVVAYTLGIYLLNLLLQFLSPKMDPALNDEEDGPTLPTTDTSDGEFKPFIRRLDEFNCWKRATTAIVIGFICTFFSFLDIPVFWPILLIYFCLLFIVTMKRQIMHMIKYRYIPFSWGKQTYKQPIIDN